MPANSPDSGCYGLEILREWRWPPNDGCAFAPDSMPNFNEINRLDGGAGEARTPDLRIANNRASNSGSVPSVTFAAIFRDLTTFCPRLAAPNVPETSLRDFTRITHGQSDH